jgi:ankyrin repeat protein
LLKVPKIYDLLNFSNLDIHAEDNDGNTPLDSAIDMEIIKYLMEQGANNSSKALLSASEQGQLEAIQYLIENNSDIEIKNEKGQTPLILLSMRTSWMMDQLAAVTYLVEQNADIQAKDNEGKSALDWAKENGREDIEKYLAAKSVA